MNIILFIIKKQEIKLVSSKFNQAIFNKNYNRVIQSLNTLDFKKVINAEIDENILKFELLGSDGLMFNHQVELTIC